MNIFLTILFTIVTLSFLAKAIDLEDFLEARINYTMATVVMCVILFFLYKI